MAATRNSNEQILLHMVARAESGELRKALESNAKGATWYNEAEKRWLERFPSDMNLFVRRGLP